MAKKSDHFLNRRAVLRAIGLSALPLPLKRKRYVAPAVSEACERFAREYYEQLIAAVERAQ